MHHRSLFLCVAVCLVALLACKRSSPDGTSPGPSGASTAVSAVGGDGSTLAKARGLERGKGAAVALTCKGKLYVGPFRFEKDPQTLIFDSVASSGGGQQCIGAQWVNDKDEFVAVAGLGCPEDNTPATMAVEHTYSPGNGGSNASPVYLRIETDLPDDCKPPKATLTLR